MSFESWDASKKQWVQMSSVDQSYFFNRARCQCGQDPAGEFRIVVQLGAGVSQKISNSLSANSLGGQGVGRFLAAANAVDCLAGPSVSVDPLIYARSCTNLLDPYNYPGNSFTMAEVANRNGYTSAPIPVAWLFGAMSGCGYNKSCNSTSDCGTVLTTTSIQFWAQTNDGSAPDFDPGPPASMNLVGHVQLAPILGAVEGGNEALAVSWTWPLGENMAAHQELLGVQLFCQRGTDTQVFALGLYGAAYMSATMVCPTLTTTPTTGVPFFNFDPRYLCSGLIPSTTTSYRIKGLQNGIPYGVGVAAVDQYGNLGALADVVYGTPSAGTGGEGGAPGTGGSGGATSGGQADGGGSADAGAGVRLVSGCSCTMPGKHHRSETAGVLWIALVTLAFALRYRSRVVPP